jgi:hypothetical protein
VPIHQVTSRRINLTSGVTVTALAFEWVGLWRLSIQETGTTSSILVTVKSGFASSEEKTQFHVAPGSGVEFAGSESTRVELLAVQANATVEIQVSPHYDSQFILEYDESGQSINNAAWTALGGNSGFPRPYMNYLAIMTSQPIDVRTTASTGAVFFEALAQPTHALILNQLKIGNHDKVEVRGSTAAAQNVRAIWYNRR